MKRLLIILASLHFFVSIGALFGGISVIIDPSGEILGISTAALKYGPFKDFLLPGLFLFIFLGIFGIIVGILTLKKCKYHTYLNFIIGMGLMIFIIIQCLVLDDIIFLHIIYFGFGFIEVLLALIIEYKTRLSQTR